MLLGRAWNLLCVLNGVSNLSYLHFPIFTQEVTSQSIRKYSRKSVPSECSDHQQQFSEIYLQLAVAEALLSLHASVCTELMFS